MTGKTRRRWCPKGERYVLAIEYRPGFVSRTTWGFITFGVSEVLLAFESRTYLCPACGAVTTAQEPVPQGGGAARTGP